MDTLPSLPLVSVVVLTYNSVSTVQETLDSIASQDYPTLEVIVCDDASIDGTVDVVRRWADQQKGRFLRIELLSSQRNLGVCRNLSRGYEMAKGEWLKGIAGDDLLMPNAISRFVAEAVRGECSVIVSLVQKFYVNDSGIRCQGEVFPSSSRRGELMLTGQEALRLWAKENPVPAPGVLLRRQDLEAVGGVDCSFVHLDDWPLWMKMQEAGCGFKLIEEPLVAYRTSPESVSYSRPAITINPQYLRDLAVFYRKHQKPYLTALERIDRSIEVFRWTLASGLLRSHPVLYKMTRLLFVFSPYRLLKMTGLGR